MNALRRGLSHGLTLLLLRLAVGGVLLVFGAWKVLDLAKFAENAANFRLLPAQGNQILAVVLPWQEVLIGLLLIIGIWKRAAALAAALLFGVFAVAIATALARGLDIDCGCFGTLTAARAGWSHLAGDGACLAAAVWIAAAACSTQRHEDTKTQSL